MQLIVKPLVVPISVLQMEALDRRLLPSHPKKQLIEAKARNLRAGYNGERALQFPLSFLPYDDYLLFYHLRIPDEFGSFQIDTLILSVKFILIIETKNIEGEICFDDMGQAIRTKGQHEESFGNPIDQVRLQHLRLLRWLRQFNFPPIPIQKIVVYSSTSTILKNRTNNKSVADMVMHKEKIIPKIEDLSYTHHSSILSEEQLSNLSFQLLSAHTPENINVLTKYRISSGELIKGVVCPDCQAAPMLRKGGKWLCQYCACSSKTAHIQALMDYELLIGSYINNREAKDFLQLESVDIVKRLLQKENLSYIGKNSGRKYKLNFVYNRYYDGKEKNTEVHLTNTT